MRELIEQLDSAVRSALGVPVVYTRGSDSVQVTAVQGETTAELIDEQGTTVETQVVDFLISKESLDAEGWFDEPTAGDYIVEQSPHRVWEVVPVGPEPCYRFADPSGVTLRIHTQLVRGSSVPVPPL